MNCNLPDFFLHGILQARIRERVASPTPGIFPGPGISFLLWEEGSLPLVPPGKPDEGITNKKMKELQIRR